MNFFIKFLKLHICLALFILVASCTNVVVTNLNDDLRRIDVINFKEGLVLKSYHQKYSPELNQWLKADCKKTSTLSKAYLSLLEEKEKSKLMLKNCKYKNNSLSKIAIAKLNYNNENNSKDNNNNSQIKMILNQSNDQENNQEEDDAENNEEKEEENNETDEFPPTPLVEECNDPTIC
tara:strand:- start:82 stop:615 length:534 start_codon:yes stop_codon:yes gene_type:complete